MNEFGQKCHYFEMETKHGSITFKVHKAVLDTMEMLSQHPECEHEVTALGDLLNIVRRKLLVVALGPKTFGNGTALEGSTDTQASARADAMTLNSDLSGIIKRGNQKHSYWLKGETYDNLSKVHSTQAVISDDDIRGSLTVPTGRSFGSIGGSLTTDSSSLVVPMLTGSLRVGRVKRPR